MASLYAGSLQLSLCSAHFFTLGFAHVLVWLVGTSPHVGSFPNPLWCVAEIPLALRQPHDITPCGVSPLVEDADVALSLHFYFLTARIPLAAAQVQHLGSPERLAFGSAPL